MKDYFIHNLTKSPKGKRATANQIGFCFVAILVILFIISSVVSSVYLSVFESARSSALQSYAISSSVALAHKPLEVGMDFPLEEAEYKDGASYAVNVYVKAANSFICVYTSDSGVDLTKDFTLEGAGEDYTKAFDQQMLIVSTRDNDDISYVTAVAPIIGSDSTVSGIVEVMMPAADYHGTVNGMSLSWIFTIISIAVSISVIYYQVRLLLLTVFSEPNRQLPKILRYGLNGCRLVSFFSALGCSMPILVISIFLKDSLADMTDNAIVINILVLLTSFLYVLGFFRLHSLREQLIRKFTARIALAICVFSGFILMLIAGIFSSPIVFMILVLPIAFCLGMVFYFLREYRIYASRLGHEGFTDTTIHKAQYLSEVLGAFVGAVISGILYERFGVLMVLAIAGIFLFITVVQALLFVQHCPQSSEPSLTLPTFVYALKNKRSGTFVWSSVIPLGIAFSFFFIFIPNFLDTVNISLATVSFYFLSFAACGYVVEHFVMVWFPDVFTGRTRITLAAILEGLGLLVFALVPTAKVLVICVGLMGFALSMHGFGYIDYYSSLLRKDKQHFSRVILERAFTLGIIIGSILFGIVLCFNSIRIPMLIASLLIIIVSLSYPLFLLAENPSNGKPTGGAKASNKENTHMNTEALPEENDASNVLFISDDSNNEVY